jgi:hypothetical protein
MDKTVKTNNIVPRLPASTINTNRNRDRIDGPGTDDQHEKVCNNSSRSNPNPQELDLFYSTDKPQASEERPIQTPPILTPCEPSPSPISSPTFSVSSGLPSEPVVLDNWELLSGDC